MSTEQDSVLAECPDCKGPYEITAVRFGIISPPSAVFVCNSCGLVQVEATEKSPKVFQRMTVMLGLMIMVFVTFYMVVRLTAIERPPKIDKLLTAVEPRLDFHGVRPR
jgi:hypothetical protein